MKRITVLILVITLLVSSSVTAFAEENSEEQYININVEFSDNIGAVEHLDVMIKDGHVYANAEELAGRLGYQVSDTNGTCVSIYNKENESLPYELTQFFYNDTKVKHMVFTKMVEDYEAPFPTISNGNGIWIPMEYSLLLLNSGFMIADNTVLIDIPEKSITDIFMDILKNNNRYRFEWEKDFGYTDDYRDFLLIDSHLVQVFNNVLKLDGDTWLLLFQTVALDYPDAYDAKYGEELAMLICTESDKELEATKKQVERWMDLFTEDGKLGKILSKYSQNLEKQVKVMYQTGETILEEVKNGNSSMAVYNRSYQALEKAFDKQTWFSNTGENILQVQKGISEALPYLEMAMQVLEVVEYGEEFKNQDEFAIQALLEYLKHSTVESITSKSMLSSILDYAESLQSNIAKYSLTRLYQENLDQWISKAFGIKEALGNQANIALLAWGLASDFIPFISNGLSAADKFELATYANIFQADAFQNYQRYREQIFSDESSLDSEKLYQLSQYCYIYLKSCYITRDAALGSLKNKIGQDELKPLIDYRNGINEEIADKLVVLKNAEKDNKTLVYGFLPDDNKYYLDKFDNSSLVEWIESYQISNGNLFEQLPQVFTFSSGAGAWGTSFELNLDGTFTGQYHDSDMGDVGSEYPFGTEYICNFRGKFDTPKQINQFTYSMNLEYIETEENVGEMYYDDMVRYIYSEPYGFDNADEFLIYLPGCPLSKIPDEFLGWSSVNTEIRETLPSGYYGIYNVGGMEGFEGMSENSIWHETYSYYCGESWSQLSPSYYSKSHLTFWPGTGAASINLCFDWSYDEQTEFLATDTYGNGDYQIGLSFNNDMTAVTVTVTSQDGHDLSLWGGTVDGKLVAEYKSGKEI